MKRLLFVLVFILGIVGGVGAEKVLAAYVFDSATAPAVSLTPDALCKFWSNQAAAQGVNADAGWNTAMQTIFSAANWPGVNATSLAFLRSFFIQYVHVGIP